jgi:hypothetical protein
MVMGGHRWRGTMLDRQREIIAVAAQVEVGIAPGVELRGASQRLTGADAATALLDVMDDEHGNVMPALQLAQVGEQRGDLAAGVIVDAVETYEWIEDEQARLQSGDGLGEVAAVGIQIEPEVGAVMTWMSRLANATLAAAEMPSRRRRTMCSASSAANSGRDRHAARRRRPRPAAIDRSRS